MVLPVYDHYILAGEIIGEDVSLLSLSEHKEEEGRRRWIKR